MTALERRLTVGAVVLPFLAFLAACALLWGGVVTARDLAILAVAYLLTGFGVTVGFHRLLTHRAFEAPPAVRVALAVLGSMSVQGNVINWVADHRKHHTFTDEEGDPHSPHTHGGEGWRGIARGIWHSHLGWIVHDRDPAPAERYARDLQDERGMVLVDRLFLVWVAIGLLLPALAGFALSGGEPLAALTGLLWGGLVRVFLLHHATWSVNSVCHIYGGRPFDTGDESRNNWALALVALGEGWHHNHHAFPTSARHGLRPMQWDPSWWVIRFLERVGLARNVRRPNPAEIARKQPAAGASLGG